MARIVLKRRFLDQLYSGYLVCLATLPLLVLSANTSAARSTDPGPAATALAALGVPVGLCIWATRTGRRGTPLLIDQATLLIKTRTHQPNRVALRGEVASHAGVIVFVASAAGLIITPELAHTGSWVADVGLRVLALVGLAVAAFAWAMAALGPLRLTRVVVTGSIYLAAATGWGTVVVNPEFGWASLATVAIATAGVLTATGGLDHLSQHRSNTRALIIGDLRVRWIVMTPLQVLSILRIARSTMSDSARGSRPGSWRSQLVSIGSLSISLLAVTSLAGGAPLRIGLIVGVLAFLLGGVLAGPLVFIAEVSRGTPHTVGARHLIWRTAQQWAPSLVLTLAGTGIARTDAGDLVRWAGVVVAGFGVGWLCALFSSVSRQLDLDSLFTAGGPELIGLALMGRWLLPPLSSVLIAVAIATAASTTAFAVNAVIIVVGVCAVCAAPIVAARA